VGVGADASVRISPTRYVGLTWAQTFEPGADASPARSGRARVALEDRRTVGLGGLVDVQWAGRDYDPGLGYVTLRDFSRVGWSGSYGWQPARGFARRVSLTFSGNLAARNEGLSLLSGDARLEGRLATRGGTSVMVGYARPTEDLDAAFAPAPGSTVPAGRYAWTAPYANLALPPGWKLRGTAGAGIGGFYDGRRAWMDLRPTWNVSPHLELGGGYHVDRVTFDGRQGFRAQVGQLSAHASLDTRLSAGAQVQYNSLAGTLAAGLRIRYALRDGDDVYLVYDDGYNTERPDAAPRLPLSDHRRVLLKVTHTFGG
jgi:hypothetical protein